MKRFLMWLLLGASIPALAQQAAPIPPQDADVMLAAVSRDTSMLLGGIGPSKWTGRGTVAVEPVARLTLSGEWKSLPCGSTGHLKTCPKFAHEYLSKPHTYTVVSADGQGATIHAAPTTLSECYSYVETGTYSGASIARSAIATSSADIFADSAPPLQHLHHEETAAIRKALAVLIPKKFDSTRRLQFFTLRLEGQDMFVVQRTFVDFDTKPDPERLKFVFVIGTMDQGPFHVLRWKQNTDDEQERVLGTIRLKSGRDFLITVVSDPESQLFRVYGIRDGHLELVYSGGGASC